ncbi:MAG: aconitate hydratase [Candidatus Thermoplasmatota archaeon]
MKKSLTKKIIEKHLLHGNMKVGEEIGISIDQTLTQDATGTMAYLQFEAMGIEKVKTKLSVSYIDHNTLQTGFENADDHIFLQSIAEKYGIYLSKAGNGICHQVHLERFAIPGQTLIGSDSHTPNAGGIGMLAFGAGGLDVAVAMGGGAFFFPMPKIVNVVLRNKLKKWVSAKDIILYLLKNLTVKGGFGKIFEYSGEGVKSLEVPERATITNMGTELGATSSIFPSDMNTKKFLKRQWREDSFKELKADDKAEYDEKIEIDLASLESMIALPHSPDNVKNVSEVEGMKVDQVVIGSCTNSSYFDLMVVAKMLEGKKVHKDISLVIAPGSRQVLEMLCNNGALANIIKAGARVLEPACGPCIGMGQAPKTSGISLRTFNRNFEGRSGTPDAKVYLCSPQVACATAINGYITDPRKIGKGISFKTPDKFLINDSLVIKPLKKKKKVEIIRGPNIKALPINEAMKEKIRGKVLIKVGDNITTDHIMPAGAKILPLRSNIPAMAEHVFEGVDKNFADRAKNYGGGAIVGGLNYGQGSSREHAALAPMYLKIKFVLAKSFARIHHANLVNFGIIPLRFMNNEDYDIIEQEDELEIENAKEQIKNGKLRIKNLSKNKEIVAFHELSERQVDIVIAGGLLNYTKERA